MVPDRFDASLMTDFWNLDWSASAPIFSPLRELAASLPKFGWPDTAVLNALADDCGRRVVNANGQQIRFVVQDGKARTFEDGFEPRAFLRGEVQVRNFNWHDLFNALVWLRFPTAKAALNARQFAALSAQTGSRRSPAGDALTGFDEDGMIVLSSDPALLELIRDFRWKALFWERRESVRTRMKFLVLGHAMYEKALTPFVGMTAKALLLQVPEPVLAMNREALLAEVDRRSGVHLMRSESLPNARALAPLPMLGVPGWWDQNEAESFYDNTSYFRPGRNRAPAQTGPSSIS